MALTLKASLLVRHAPPAVADAFCATRLGGDWAYTFGTLPVTAGLARSWSARCPTATDTRSSHREHSSHTVIARFRFVVSAVVQTPRQ
jgi:hypothetical protein